jgi:hypothetical protein
MIEPIFGQFALSVLRGAAQALGARLVSRPKDEVQIAVLKEQVATIIDQQKEIQISLQSRPRLEDSLIAHLQLILSRIDGFRVTETGAIKWEPTQNERSLGHALFDVKKEIDGLREADVARQFHSLESSVHTSMASELLTRSTGLLDGLNEEILRERLRPRP